MGDVGRPYRHMPNRGLSPLFGVSPWYLPRVWQVALDTRTNTGFPSFHWEGHPAEWTSSYAAAAQSVWQVSDGGDYWGDLSCVMNVLGITGQSLWRIGLLFTYANPLEPILDGTGTLLSDVEPTTIPYGPTGYVPIIWDNALTALIFADCSWSAIPLPGY